jgi:hypothetical protein
MAINNEAVLYIVSDKGNANQTALRFHLTPVRMAVIKKTNNKWWQG